MSKGGSESSSSQHSSFAGNSTTTPVIPEDWLDLNTRIRALLGDTGATPAQQSAMSFTAGQLGGNSPVNAALPGINSLLWGIDQQYGGINKNLYDLAMNGPRQAGAALSGGSTAHAALAGPVANAAAGTGAAASSPYAQLYGSAVTDPALAAYDYGTARGLSALDARTAAGGAFANSRSEIPYDDLISQAALGRGQLSASLNQQGLNQAFGFGQQDANRSADLAKFNSDLAFRRDMFNTGNQQAANIFNAQQQQQNDQFNAGALNQNSQFNVDAANQADRMKASFLAQAAQNLGARVGLSQAVMNNIVTANGLDLGAAKTLFDQGAITANQLQELLKIGTARFGRNTTSSGSQDAVGNSSNSKFGFGIGDLLNL
jgi:hypothetical protein